MLYLSSPVVPYPSAAAGAVVTSAGAYVFGAWVNLLNPVPVDSVLVGYAFLPRMAGASERRGFLQFGVNSGTLIAEVPFIFSGGSNLGQATPIVFCEGIDLIPAGAVLQARACASINLDSFADPPMVAALIAAKPLSGTYRTTTKKPRTYPSASPGVGATVTPSGVVWTDGSWAEIIPAAATDLRIDGWLASGGSQVAGRIDIGVGPGGSEVVVQTFPTRGFPTQGTEGPLLSALPLSGAISAGDRVSARVRLENTATTNLRFYLVASEEY